MTKIKSLLQKRQTSLCPGHEWLAIVVLWFHWNVFILATATSTFEQRNSARNGSDRASDWSYQECTSCHTRKKVFFCSWNFLCEKFPIKHCSTHNMWIRWSFRSISSSSFHRKRWLCIFEYLRIRDWQPISSIKPECCISENSSRTFAGVALHSKKFTN